MQHSPQRGTAEISTDEITNQMATPGCRLIAVTPASPAFQASFNEQIKHIIRKLHAVFVQPQQQQDKSLCGMIERHMIFARPIDHFPDFDRLVVRSRHDLGPVRGKRHRPDVAAVAAVRIRLLAQQVQFVCQTSRQASVLAKEGRVFELAAHLNPRL